MRRNLAFLAILIGAPAFAQTTANLPVTCNASATNCIQATPVVNPDGTNIGSGAGGGTPTGSAGTPNAAVVTVQGISGGTVVPVSAATLPLPTGAATESTLSAASAKLPASLGAKTGATSLSVVPNTDTAFPVVGNVASGATAGTSPVLVGGLGSGTTPTSVTTGQAVRAWYAITGATVISIASRGGSDGISNNVVGYMAAQDGSVGSPLVNAPMVFNGTSWDRQPGSTTGAFMVSKGTGTLATGQVSVTTSSTQVVAARTGRGKVTLSVGAANTCAFGNTGVTTTTGFPLQPVAGATITLDTSAAIFAACSATTTVSYIEQY